MTGAIGKPCKEAALLYAAKLGLPDEQVEMFLDYYESNGWRVGRSPMKSWEAAMRNWRRNWEARNRPVQGKRNGATVWEMKAVLEAKVEEQNRLKNRYALETALGLQWQDDNARKDYLVLKKEIIALKQKIAHHGL